MGLPVPGPPVTQPLFVNRQVWVSASNATTDAVASTGLPIRLPPMMLTFVA